MDAGYCVGGQQVLKSEKMPFATLRWAKASKGAKERRSCQEWLVSISTNIICVWPSDFSSRFSLIPQSLTIDRGYDTIRGETREGAERSRGNVGQAQKE